jgi:hypothetical protein
MTLTVQQGGSGTTQLTLTPRNGFTGPVNLSLENPPAGVTLFPTSVNVTGSNPAQQTLTLNVASSVAATSYTLTLKATSGSITKMATLNLTVTSQGGGGGGGGGSGSPGTTWTWRSGQLFSITYGNGLFVAAWRGGTLLTSPDGVTWTLRTTGTASVIEGVAYGNSLFMAVGRTGTILTSP